MRDMSSRTTEIAAKIVTILVPFVVEQKREMTYGELRHLHAQRGAAHDGSA